jgi:hypothetical protein
MVGMGGNLVWIKQHMGHRCFCWGHNCGRPLLGLTELTRRSVWCGRHEEKSVYLLLKNEGDQETSCFRHNTKVHDRVHKELTCRPVCNIFNHLNTISTFTFSSLRYNLIYFLISTISFRLFLSHFCWLWNFITFRRGGQYIYIANFNVKISAFYIHCVLTCFAWSSYRVLFPCAAFNSFSL